MSREKEPISDPCCDSHPAQGFPACKAVNFATVDDVFIPPGLGLETISKGGLISFSNTVKFTDETNFTFSTRDRFHFIFNNDKCTPNLYIL